MKVGCFVGHDLRRLVYDGALSANLYAVDIFSHWEVGFEMFRDQSHFDAHFISADIQSENPALSLLKGKVDVISIFQVLHQCDWNGQMKAAKILTTFTKPGWMIIGNQIANPKAQVCKLRSIPIPVYRHNPESLAKFWNQVGDETGTKWKTQAWMQSFEQIGWDAQDGAWMEPGVAMIQFAITQIE
jgi:hypothetical protein